MTHSSQTQDDEATQPATRRTFLRGVGTVAASTTIMGQASATHNDTGALDGFFGDDSGAVAEIYAGVQGRMARTRHSVFGSESELSATESATQTTTYFNDNSGDFVSYANTHVADSTDKTKFNVFEFTFKTGDDTATRYLTATVSSGDYTDASMVSSTDKTVDETITIRNDNGMADDFPALIEEFNTDFVQDDREPSRAWAAKTAGRYGIGQEGDFETSIGLPEGAEAL